MHQLTAQSVVSFYRTLVTLTVPLIFLLPVAFCLGISITIFTNQRPHPRPDRGFLGLEHIGLMRCMTMTIVAIFLLLPTSPPLTFSWLLLIFDSRYHSHRSIMFVVVIIRPCLYAYP